MSETVFISKYALSDGIRECRLIDTDGYLVTVEWPGGLNNRMHFHKEGCDWHRTWDGAAARAEIMRTQKIQSLSKQIDKLHKMKLQP